MALKTPYYDLSCLFLLILSCSTLLNTVASHDEKKTYIVYMGDRPEGELPISALHLGMLQNVLGSDFSPEHLLHSFSKSFNGFVVKLSEKQAEKIAGIPGVVSVFLSEKKQLHTTRSWDFMGFPQQVERSNLESDIIVGVIDSGIWPESASFNDRGLGPPPSKWKGSCDPSFNFTCNNKIIGAKFFRSNMTFLSVDLRSPRDSNGHGTHTASTAAGGIVSMASLYGFAAGTARGGVPSARIAVYKVCWLDGCYDHDILAAFDHAIADGVDIISISIGGTTVKNYFEDGSAIGSFHAMRNGILTSISAGNEGPKLGTTTNVAPWSLSVAASTIDRKFVTQVQLGSQNTYKGISINTFDLKNAMYPLIYGGDAPNIAGNFNSSTSRFCTENSLDPKLVKGKIVVCDDEIDGMGPLLAGAVGILMQDQGPKDKADPFPLPASRLDTDVGQVILSYIRSTSGATATIYRSNEVNDTIAPYVVSFSSRGPNPLTRDILKPDITAPGVHILAAWSNLNSVSEVQGDNRFVPYNILSGTSMACPHVSGIAAYIKSYHPTWSPAAIKSAIMTTAFPMSTKLNPEAEFAYGAGHVIPLNAINPGLIYDADEIDYLNFLCGQGYNITLLQNFAGDGTTCSKPIDAWDLNYPSFAVSATPSVPFSRVLHRVVTNVGSPNSTYRAVVIAPDDGLLKISVNPVVLSFTSLGEKLSFSLEVEGTVSVAAIVSASLVWYDGEHQVRSPISVIVAS